ncbi:trypsin-like serine peptidase [Parafrankia elaeagni]|uniref:trypsin-like serine peptidase n=1 Tax=Parafrankia elaeagni TaxID=222534 RepID=UPI001E3A17F0|nr:hypothetical protein [Parafrankia elaeagni]
MAERARHDKHRPDRHETARHETARHEPDRPGRAGRRRLAVATAALALCTLAPAVPALAAVATGGVPAAGPPPRSVISEDLPGPFAGRYSEPLERPLAKPMSAPVALSGVEQARISAYWSAERRTRAQAAGTVDRDGAPVPRALDGPAATWQAPVRTGPPPPATGTPYTYGGLVTRTVGRLFTTLRGIDYACTATVVSSPGRDLAVTAGHCLHEGNGGQFATNVAFMPGFADGSPPFGLWTARRITVTPDWGLRGNFDYDTGFVLFNTLGGRHIQDVVGAQKIAFNQPRTSAQYAFGYPRLAPYDGDRLIYCAGPPTSDPYGTASIGLRCDMTGGASGGPLFVGLGRAGPGAGWVDSVVSYAYAGDPGTVYGTYFGRAIELLYYQSSEL